MSTAPIDRSSPSAGRLLGALALTSILLGPFAYFVYDAGLAQSVVAVAGVVALLVLSVAVAWASDRRRGR